LPAASPRRRSCLKDTNSLFFGYVKSVFDAHQEEHPLISSLQRTGDGSARQISDVLGVRSRVEALAFIANTPQPGSGWS
jgi:hypothetical protein